MFLLFNAIADNNGIPEENRPTTEHDWHLLLDQKYKPYVCQEVLTRCYTEDYVQKNLSEELYDFLEKSIRKHYIHTIFTTCIDFTLEAVISTICSGDDENGEENLPFCTYNFMDDSSRRKFYDRSDDDKQQIALVYLFGKIGDLTQFGKPINFVYSEDDAMAEIARYFQASADNNGERIKNVFHNHPVMAIGCRFEDWKFRFFWYAIRGSVDNLGNGTIAYSCPDTQTDSLYKYLLQKGSLSLNTDSRNFMKQLSGLMDSEEILMEIRRRRREGVFLSYASEDILTAKKTFDYFLDKRGIPIWMDICLKESQLYYDEIKKHINRMPIFCPILSTQVKHDLLAGNKRFYMDEWEYAARCGKQFVPITVGDYDIRSEYHLLFRNRCGLNGNNDIHIKSINERKDLADVMTKILTSNS